MMNFAIAGPMPLRWYVWWMSWHAASASSRSGSTWAAGGSCATRVRTCSGWRATRASALTAPPLLAKMSTGPASSAAISRCRSSAWLVRRGLGGIVGAYAALDSAGVVGHDGAVVEVSGQGAEPAGAHRRPDDQQGRRGARVVAADVVVQHGAGHVQGVGLQVGHGCLFLGVLRCSRCSRGSLGSRSLVPTDSPRRRNSPVGTPGVGRLRGVGTHRARTESRNQGNPPPRRDLPSVQPW